VTTIDGRVWRFGDDLNTDVIHPPDFFSLDPDVVAKGLFHKHDPTIQPRIRPGDVIVGGRNLGCGSSRETSIQSLRLNRIGAVIAVDFGRIFFRNATNQGLPCLTFAEATDVDRIADGDHVTVALDAAVLTTSSGASIPLVQPGDFVRRIWASGGLLGLLPAPEAAPAAGS
jgi:3-isopropylmalate dehydratase small subunit